MSIIKIYVNVLNIANVIGLFDEVQVHRSITGELGAYVEITGPASAAATLLGTNDSGSFTLDTLTLLIEVDGGAEQTITFVSADPINIDDVVDFLNDPITGISGVTASEDTGALRLTSDELGTDSVLEITGGTALTELGFITGDKDWGEDPRITLVAGTTSYTYDDLGGDVTYWYKTRYYNSTTGDVSPFGTPKEGQAGAVVAPGDMVTASGQLAKLNGDPWEGARIAIHPVYPSQALFVNGIAVMNPTITIETDVNGLYTTLLVIGALVDVSIGGTGITRRITVPGTDFDLLEEVAAADDAFQIHTHEIPAAPRRS